MTHENNLIVKCYSFTTKKCLNAKLSAGAPPAIFFLQRPNHGMLGHLVSPCTFVLASKTLVGALVLPPKRLSRGAGETLPRPAPGRVPGVAALL